MRALLALAAAATLGATSPPACDTACLTGLAAAYMDALPNRGSSAHLPWADRVRYSENGVPMMVDDGIWATVTAHSVKPLVVADPDTGNLVWLGTIDEHGQPAFFALRLKANGRRIAEAETVIRRKEGRPPFGDPVAFAQDPAFAQILPKSARMPRAQMIALVQNYFRPGVIPHLAADCARTENGVAAGCAEPYRDIDRVRGLNFAAVDEARGLMAVIGDRDYSARPRKPAGEVDAKFPHSYAFVAVFKVQGGAISRIEEVSSDVPYLMPTWKDAE